MLINNVLEHSNASNFITKFLSTINEAHFILNDNGENIFNNIKSKFKLPNVCFAALELTKGYVSTNPKIHSGEELYAVINLFDFTKIDSSGKSLTFTNENTDWELKPSLQKKDLDFTLKSVLLQEELVLKYLKKSLKMKNQEFEFQWFY